MNWLSVRSANAIFGNIFIVALIAASFSAIPNVAFAQYNYYSYTDTPDYGISSLGGGYDYYSYADTPSYTPSYDNYSYANNPSYGGGGYDYLSYADQPDYGVSNLGSSYGYDYLSYADSPDYNIANLGGGFVPDTKGGFVPDYAGGFVPDDCGTYTCYKGGFVPDYAGGFVPDSVSPYAGGFVPDECSNCYAYTTPSGETVMASPTYSQQTPNYSAPCNCYVAPAQQYQSAYIPASYYVPASAYATLPLQARSSLSATYIPSSYSSYNPVPPRHSTPSYSASYVPSHTSNVNTNTNSNPSSAFVWSPVTNTSTNTNTPVATATNGPITNTNTASTGAITNTFAPVINVNGGGAQHPVQYTFPRPVCTITASNVYGYNQPVTLSWSSQNATSAYLSPTGGNVALSGSMTVTTVGYTTYTLTVTGQGGSATCQATVNATYPVSTYAPSYTVPPQAAAPYVSLSQIPYTGFDYGPFGNAMYWMALLAFAAAAGYLIVYGVPKMSFSGVFARTGESAYATPEVAEVFKSNLAASTDSAEEVPEVVETPTTINTFSLPAVENRRITTDSMFIERKTGGAPRIVIARS